MPIQFRCHHCSKRVQAPNSAGGKKAKCPKCGQLVEVPVVKPEDEADDDLEGFDDFFTKPKSHFTSPAPPQPEPPPPPLPPPPPPSPPPKQPAVRPTPDQESLIESQGDGKYQEHWEKQSRQRTKREVSDAWSDERKHRKKFGKPLIVGYRIKVGKNCQHAKPYDGMVLLIEDVYDEPDLLPPFIGCAFDTCECKYTRATSDQRGKARIILAFDNPELQARLTTRYTSPVGFEHSSHGGKARRIRKKKSNEAAGCGCALLCGLALLVFAGLAAKLL